MVSGKTEDSETEGKGAQTSRAEVGRDSRKRRSRSGTAETTDYAEEGCSEKAAIHPEKRSMRGTTGEGKDREDVNQAEIGEACAVKECEREVTEQGQRQRQEEQGKLGGADVPPQKRGRGRPRKIVNQVEIGKACSVKECEGGVTEQGQRQRLEEQGKLGGADVPPQKRGRGRPRKIQPATQAVSQSADTSPQVVKIVSGATKDDNTHTHTHTLCVNE